MIASLIDHLWQSSFFAACAWLVVSRLRKNGAHLRYWMWFAASVKFLIPMSLLVTTGAWLGQYIMPIIKHSQVTHSIYQVATPVIAPAEFFVSVKASVGIWAYVLGMLWAIGFIGLIIRWIVRWFSIRNAVRAATQTGFIDSIPVMISPILQEPGVVGIFRPVLLLPEGIADRLTGKQMQAILDHELCHVRRRDNLTSVIQMVVESLFWFHPLVWWIGARMIDERERACDEAVVRSGNAPKEYAEGILKVCQHFLVSKVTCVAGVSGANLKHRLEMIMKNDVITELSVSRKILIGTVAIVALAGPVMIGLIVSKPSYARGLDAKTTVASTSVGKIEMLNGKRVRLNFQDVDVRSLLAALAEAAQVNILVSDKVSGTISLRLEEMAWDRALDIILAGKGLTRHEKDGIIFIDSLPAAT